MATSGYVVLDENGRPMHHHEGILYRSGGRSAPVTLFNTRGTANRAIERTREYANDRGLSWRADRYTVGRVAPYESSYAATTESED